MNWDALSATGKCNLLDYGRNTQIGRFLRKDLILIVERDDAVFAERDLSLKLLLYLRRRGSSMTRPIP